jgi:preprotein translocase subunit SecD
MRYSPWKVAAILGVCALGFLFALPNLFSRETLDRLPGFLPKGQVVLGLDLQGGSSLLLEVETAAILRERLENMVNDVRGGLRGARINYRGLGVERDG